MSAGEELRSRPDGLRPAAVATVHALTWLVIANAIGLLLATLLLAPDLGRLLGPLTYGRWMPLHLDLQLYGWCSLPLVALLLHAYLPARRPHAGADLALAAWSASLLYGALSWLAGRSSGKLFLEWSGAARLLFVLALATLAVVLVWGYRQRLRQPAQEREPRLSRWAKLLLLAALVAVPAVLYWAAGPDVQPPVNPDSGGPTGASLLGSTLGIVTVMLLVPLLAGLRSAHSARSLALPFTALAAHFSLFAALDHGSASHHDPIQVLALFSLFPWLPIMAVYLRRFDWPAPCRRWLAALGAWSLFLLVQAPLTFLPGALERYKFTNLLVGHAHLAMAGLVTSLDVVVLVAILDRGPMAAAFAARRPFWLWQGGALAMIVTLMAQGLLEGSDPGRLFRPDAATTVLYALRWFCGAAMLAGSWYWLRASLRACSALLAASRAEGSAEAATAEGVAA